MTEPISEELTKTDSEKKNGIALLEELLNPVSGKKTLSLSRGTLRVISFSLLSYLSHVIEKKRECELQGDQSKADHWENERVKIVAARKECQGLL